VTAAEAFFLGTGTARRFAVCWRPPTAAPARGALLFVPPFAEEMNKSRRMVALAATALAAAGFTTLRIDLTGCGDSAGRLDQARWDDWLADVTLGARWLDQHTGCAPWLWSLRAGALLAQAALDRLDAVAGQLLWQPVLSGRQHLTQFLRLRVAADAFAVADPAARASTRSLLQALEAGQHVEVAGYTLPASIALPLASAELTAPPGASAMHWLEVAADEPPAVSALSAERIAHWQAGGRRVSARAVGGPPFWGTQEIEDCPALIDATLEAMCAAA
jgi:exosortase A-associated hydrolase 2